MAISLTESPSGFVKSPFAKDNNKNAAPTVTITEDNAIAATLSFSISATLAPIAALIIASLFAKSPKFIVDVFAKSTRKPDIVVAKFVTAPLTAPIIPPIALPNPSNM